MEKNPRICLIDVVEKGAGSLDPPLNLVSLANYLVSQKRSKKEDFRILNSSFEDVLGKVKSFKPDIIGFSVMTPFYNLAVDLALKIRDISKATFIIGGYHISAIPETLGHPFDIGVVGEGEYPLVDLVDLWLKGKLRNGRELGNIPGIVFFNEKGKVVKNRRAGIFDVASLPIVDWSIVPEYRVVKYITLPINGMAKTFRMASTYTARGCPYSCAFCAHRVLTNGIRGVRYFPLEKVLDEFEYLYREYKVDCIQVLDDTFAVTKKRLRDLIGGLERRELLGKICFYNLFIRANLVDEEFVSLLKKLGATTVFIGIESASSNVLKVIKDGPMDMKMAKTAVKCFLKENLYVTGSFMIFSPGEKECDLEKSMDLANWFCDQRNSIGMVFSVTTPYPGTRLWDQAIKSGVVDINKPNWEDFVMFYLKDIKRMPKVFYVPKWADVSKRFDYWQRFIKMSDRVRANVIKIDGWVKTERDTIRKNRDVLRLYTRTVRSEQFLKRIERFVGDPKRSIQRFISRPKIILWIFDDLRLMLTG